MLNIGRLSDGAGEYYVTVVADSVEDYYDRLVPAGVPSATVKHFARVDA